MAALRSRVPVILEQQNWEPWLGEGGVYHLALMRLAEAGVVRLWPVSRSVNSVRNNGAKLLVTIVDPAPQTSAEAAVDLAPA